MSRELQVCIRISVREGYSFNKNEKRKQTLKTQSFVVEFDGLPNKNRMTGIF